MDHITLLPNRNQQSSESHGPIVHYVNVLLTAYIYAALVDHDHHHHHKLCVCSLYQAVQSVVHSTDSVAVH